AKSWSDVVQGSPGHALSRVKGSGYSGLSLAPATYGSQPEQLASMSDVCSPSAAGEEATNSDPVVCSSSAHSERRALLLAEPATLCCAKPHLS
ncbi:hypothetical protein GGH95_002181, partial [Coemansia sp. RSA 1836]